MIISNLIFPYDYIILTFTFIIILFSFWKGFIQSVLGLLTWVGSILISIYAYESFADFITKQLLTFEFFRSIEYQTNIIGIIFAIPIIFLISLFILKKIRNFLSSDLDKQILGIIIDKVFGFIYGILFSYVIITTILILFNKFDLININDWLIDNSNIFLIVNDFNNKNIFLIEPIEEFNN
tara:strand:+ start:216 stop:758 length:543 start_codon:yes stop_codon:yes gene_type:complete